MCEDELLVRLRTHDEKAFDELILKFKGVVYRTAFEYLKNREDAKEITQDVFITAFKKIWQFKGESSLSTWLMAIARNKSLNMMRQIEARNKPLVTENEFSAIEEIIDTLDPLVVLENKEIRTQIFKSTTLLPEKQRTAFLFRYIENLSPSDISDIMNISVGSVESFLQRAKANLRNHLNNYRKQLKK